jgi:hypothetical protein
MSNGHHVGISHSTKSYLYQDFFQDLLLYILSRVVYVTRQITLRRIQYSEFIPLALTVTQFTISQLLPSAVSQLLIL